MADTKEPTLAEIFDKLDVDKSGCLSLEELKQALVKIGVPEDDFNAILKEADEDGSGTISRNEFMKAMQKADKNCSSPTLHNLVKETKSLMQVKTKSGGVHTYATEEVQAFTDHINQVLKGDPQLDAYLPIDTASEEIFEKCGDGVILAKFVNKIAENTIDMRVVNIPKKDKKLTIFKVNENLNLVINACKGIGVKGTASIGAEDVRTVENPSLVLGLLWQMVKMHLLADINLKAHPELIRLLEEGEELGDLLKLSPEKILLRWMNYHLKEAESKKRIKNFGAHVKDSEAYTIVMNRIAPQSCDTAALKMDDKKKRAKHVLKNSAAMGCHPFIKPSDIVRGNEKLNLAFVADLFNHCPGLDPIEEEKLAELAGMMEDDVGDSREERAFRMWANCLGIEDFYLNNLFDDFEDGLNLLKVLDAVEPGIVNWKKVEKKPTMVFKKNSNNSYAVVLGKSLGLSLPGTGGGDITTKNKKLVLGYVWQLFRYHSIKFLKELGDDANEATIVEFANKQVETVGKSGGSISNFKDKTLGTGVFLAELAASLNEKVVDWELITAGNSDEDAMLNARYAVSLARKFGCAIFCLPEDIVECKHKMILTFCAAIMQKAKNN